MSLLNRLVTVLPFYKDKRNQDRFKENVSKNCPMKLYSPNNALLPFMIRLPKDSSKPVKWELVDSLGIKTDISNNIPLLKAYNFSDAAYCYYKGEPLNFVYESFSQELDRIGFFHLELTIDSIVYYSEVFYMTKEISNVEFSDKFVKIEFSDIRDIEPLRYRDGFKQVIYLDTFIHSTESEIEDDNETDGDGNRIPIFTRLIFRQNMSVYVQDFVKNALMTLAVHDDVFVNDQNKQSGYVDRKTITPTPDEDGAFSTVDITLETDVMVKKMCEDNIQAINENLWQ